MTVKNKPRIVLETCDNCDKIVYNFTIDPGVGELLEVSVIPEDFLSILGRSLDLLNKHRRDVLDDRKKSGERNELNSPPSKASI